MRRRLVLSAVVSLLALWGCSKFKVAPFVAPIWDTQFSAPLFDRTYTLGEILYRDSVTYVGGDTTHLSTTPSGVFSISTRQAIAGIPVGDNLEIASVPEASYSQTLGSITIQSPDSIHYGIPNPVPANTTAPVPAFQKDTTISPKDVFSSYKSATISKGTLHIIIHNGYPAPVGFGGKIYILDKNGNPLEIPIDTIQANDSNSTDLPLNGTELTPNPPMLMTYGSPGLPLPQTASYTSSTLLSISSSFSNLEVSKATAIVPQQNPITLNQSIVLVEGTKVNYANIKSGELDLTITNGFNMPLGPISLVVSGLDSQSVPLRRTLNLPAGGSVYSPIDLSGWQLNLSDAGVPSDSVHYAITVGIPGSNGRFVDIDTSNFVKATFSMTNLVFSSFSGVIHPQNTFSVANDVQKIDLGDFKSKLSGGITLVGDSTKLDLNIRSAGFPYFVHLRLKLTSTASSSAPLDSVSVDTIIYPGANKIGIGKAFVDALNSFSQREKKIPDEFIVAGSALVNPQQKDVPFPYSGGNDVGTISDTDKITIYNAISMPFDIGIVGGAYIDTTTKPVFDSSLSAKMTEVDSGDIHFDIWNGLPVSLSFVPLLIDTLDHSITTLDSVVVAAPTQFDNNGIVVSPIFSPNVIKLTGPQARKFDRSLMRYKFSLETAGATANQAPPVPFSKNNTIRLKVYADLTFKIDKNLTGGK